MADRDGVADDYRPWGVPDALFGWVFGIFLALVWTGFFIGVTDYDPGETVGIGSDLGRSAGQADLGAPLESNAMPLWATSLGIVPLWIGMAGAVVVAVHFRGARLREDLRVEFSMHDIPMAVGAGVAAQFVLTPLLTLPLRLLDDGDVSAPARALIDSADKAGIGGIFVLVLTVCIGAPFFEELFYRGLLMAGLERHMPQIAALIVSAGIFALVHFQWLQFPALMGAGLVFGYLAQRTGRLGSSFIAHMAFNSTTVVLLLAA